MILPSVVRSGGFRSAACAPPSATRNPVITSSKISSAPCRAVSSRSASRNPGAGGTQPMLPTTGSTITAAILSPRVRERRSTAAIELNGSAMVVSANACGHARGIGDAQRRHAGAGLHQQRIDVAVIAAFELDGQVAPGESARHAQRAHGGFGAGVHQAHHLHRRHGLRDQLRQLDFALGGRAEAGADFENLAQRRRSPAAGDGPASAAPRSTRNRCSRCRRRRRCASLRRAR